MFFITCPSHDDITTYISIWSKEIINTARYIGKDFIQLKDAHAIKSKVHNILSNKPIRFAMFNGHGNKNTITGHNNETLINSPGNEDLLKSKIVYCRSCCSGHQLGPDSINAGADAFIGYDKEFIFVYEIDKIDNPLEDKCASQFLEPTNHIAISLLKGKDVETANKESKQIFMENIKKLLGSDSKEDLELLSSLVWNMRHQVIHGNEKTKY